LIFDVGQASSLPKLRQAGSLPHVHEVRMATHPLRVGLIGAGANTRARHIPGLRAIEGVEIVAVCNRRHESTLAAAREFNIPRTYRHWEEVVADRDLDAVIIGTWPYLHCPISLAALAAGKHVLTEARLSLNAADAQRMLDASDKYPKLVTQVVPSPYGLKGHDVMRGLIDAGFLGELREVRVYTFNAALADEAAPLSWRQDAALSGYNMLNLGIVHETLLRWAPPPVRVLAQVHAFLPSRIDPQSGVRRPVGTPDSVQVLTVLESGARGTYHISGVTPFGQSMGIELYGREGALHYDLLNERIRGASVRRGQQAGPAETLPEIPIPAGKERRWTVEADFVSAIRTGKPVEFTTFATGVAYMQFTEAVARSAESGEPVDLPLG
jgi:predicted dehydrogenase